MAGFLQRLSMIFQSKANKAVEQMEDPRETLDYAYQRQLDMLQQVRRSVTDVATSRKRLELQAAQLAAQGDKLTAAAQRALQLGREDLAREALTRKSGLERQLSELHAQHAQLAAEEEKLVRAANGLQQRADAFRVRKETIKASYSAAEAQTRVNEALTGLGDEWGDVGQAIQRAEDRTAALQARAGAVDELLASGALSDPTAGFGDDLTRELDALASGPQVESELAALKAQLAAGSAPSALPSGEEPPYEQPPTAPSGQSDGV